MMRILLLGDKSVGKTTLSGGIGPSSNLSSVINIDFWVKQFEIDGKVIKLQLTELHKKKQEDSTRTRFYTGIQSAIFIFDLTKPETCEDLFEN